MSLSVCDDFLALIDCLVCLFVGPVSLVDSTAGKEICFFVPLQCMPCIVFLGQMFIFFIFIFYLNFDTPWPLKQQ